MLRSGGSAPINAYIYPFDGLNGSWRWSPYLGGWIGPSFAVSWTAGDVIPVPDASTQYRVDVYATTSPGISTLFDDPAYLSFTPSGNAWRVTTPVPVDSGPQTATTTESGSAFVVQTELGSLAGDPPTTVPDAGLNVLSMIGPLVVDSTFTFPDEIGPGDGEDGDFWLVTTTGYVYGPKAGGLWPSTPLGKLFDPAGFNLVTGVFSFSPADPALPPVVVAASDAPADAVLSDSEVAVWYDDATGSPSVNFKGKDDAGTVFTASVPLT